jgi:very-short-patch-repair endonuclease
LKKIEDFIRSANDIHGSVYSYNLYEGFNLSNKVEIVCKRHGKFYQNGYKHLSGQKCPKCNNEEKQLTIQEFVVRATSIHQSKYDYSLVSFSNTRDKIIIICREHGEFKQFVNNHLNKKYGCKKCADSKKSISVDDFLVKANIVHNNKYHYELSGIINNRQKINIFCKKHGRFEQSILNHLSGNGCYMCKSSKGEMIICNYLERNKYNFKREKTFDKCVDNRKLKFDFFLIDNNICIEFDGYQHFNSVELFGGDEYLINIKNKDSIKTQFCLDNDIRLLRIKYDQINNIDKILDEFLVNY